MTATGGWTWEYVDEYMTLPRLEALTDYWAENPPIHIAMSGILQALGGKKKKPARKGFQGNYDMPVVPKDAKDNPTKEIPATIQQAAFSLGGGVIRPTIPTEMFDKQ